MYFVFSCSENLETVGGFFYSDSSRFVILKAVHLHSFQSLPDSFKFNTAHDSFQMTIYHYLNFIGKQYFLKAVIVFKHCVLLMNFLPKP